MTLKALKNLIIQPFYNFPIINIISCRIAPLGQSLPTSTAETHLQDSPCPQLWPSLGPGYCGPVFSVTTQRVVSSADALMMIMLLTCCVSLQEGTKKRSTLWSKCDTYANKKLHNKYKQQQQHSLPADAALHTD